MKEDFLHFIWEYGLFDQTATLFTTGNAPVEIVSCGQRNTNAGPDFFNAKIRIDNTLWAGNVEIHKRSSDWRRHAHSDDKAYDNVILHVVADDDEPITITGGALLPTLVIRCNEEAKERYAAMLQSYEWVACGKDAASVDLFHIKHFLDRLLVERLEHKAQQIHATLQSTCNDWREAFYQLLFRTFGFGVNTVPFEMLAKVTPLTAIGKHRYSLLQMEALLFGQAGFLQGAIDDEYQQILQKEYTFLQSKFSLMPMNKHIWNFLRLRPCNFPTIRIAQLAQLLHLSDNLIDKIFAFSAPADLLRLFTVQASEYWETHFIFGKISRKSSKLLGESSVQRIMANLIVPYLFAYGQWHGNDSLCEKAIELLEIIPPEKNHITDGWKRMGVKAENAFYGQALIQLKTNYCDSKQCLHCAIGTELIKNKIIS